MHAYSSEMATADMHADNREAAPVVVSQKQRIIRIVPKETVIPKEIPISGIFSSHPSPQKVSVDQTDAPPELESIQFIKYWLEKVETENIGVNYDMGTEMRAENNETATEDMYADMSEFSERDGGIVLDLSTQSNRHAASNEDTRQSLHKNLLDSDDDLETNNSASEYQPDGESEDSDSTGASVRRAARQSTDVQGELISLLPESEVSIASVERQEKLDVEEPAFVTKKKTQVLEKRRKQIEKKRQKHPFIENGCNPEKCKKKCKEFAIDQRRQIYDKFQELSQGERIAYIKSFLLVTRKKRITVKDSKRTKCRDYSFVYRLPIAAGELSLVVCQKTFLSTLGYTSPKVIEVISRKLKTEGVGFSPSEKRGGARKVDVDREAIRMHIESFKPCQPHYRRYNSPYVRYIPRDITFEAMFADFQEKFPEQRCSQSSYLRVLQEMNISNKMPRSDVCEICDLFKIKESRQGVSDEEREKQQEHRNQAEKARRELDKDADHAHGEEKAVFTVDMQKVLILPIQPAVKESHFTSRLVCFNETFVPPLSSARTGSSPEVAYCVVWHEATYGRTGDAVASAFFGLVDELRDTKEFTFWADNCSSQNKNWIIFSMFVRIVNESWGPEKISIKFLTKGHTHMAADSLHGVIEKKIRAKQVVEDFPELKKVMQDSRQNTRVKELQISDFYEWKNEKSGKKSVDIQLGKIVQASFMKKDSKLYYRYDFDDELKAVDFLTVKAKSALGKGLPKKLSVPRGISRDKKNNILMKLVPHIADTRKKSFWKNIHTANVQDLVDEFEGCEPEDE